MPETEMLQRDKEILQGATEADVQLTRVWIGDPLPARAIRVKADLVPADSEIPRLGVAIGRREDRVTQQKSELFEAGATRGVVRLAERPGIGR